MNLDLSTSIRPARPGDEAELANAHLHSWREAYKGLLPQSYLDDLPLTFKNRKNAWLQKINEPEKFILQVAESKYGIVGFACLQSARDEDRKEYAEVSAIYLLEKFKGKGIGFKLLASGLKQIQQRGFNKAYCWVLEGNPTVKFYEKSGARFDGTAKDDEIGGMKCRDLRYVWEDINIGDYHWEPLSPQQLSDTLKGFKSTWAIAGGWAIDLFLDRQTRPHEDIDMVIQRADQHKLQEYLNDWELWVADPPGTLRQWKKGEYIGKGLQDIWARKPATSTNPENPWQIQIMLFDVGNENWIFKRDESIRKPLNETLIPSKKGHRILAPEIQLLYKSKSLRPKDQMDFKSAVNTLSAQQKLWLKQALQKIYGTHIWIDAL